MEKISFPSENRNGILWDSIPLYSCPTSLSPCVHKAYFQVTVNVTVRLPRTRKHRVTAPAHAGDLERTGTPTFISWFWVQPTYGVQIGYNSEAKEEEQEKNT